MAAAQHTPGPWSFWESDDKAKEPPAEGGLIEAPFGICAADSGISIASLWFGTDCGQHISRGEVLANADLISAAPEMLEALKAVHAPYATLTEDALQSGILMEHGPPKPAKGAALLLVRAAIAKAEGH